MLKILTINHSDITGGAARAAYRIHHSIRRLGLDSKMLVNNATSGDWTVKGPKGKLAKALSIIRIPLAGLLTKTLKTANPIIHSPAIIPSRWSKRLNKSDADVIHLHWINGEMMSIADIGNIKKPVIWTLHDMWAFCGAEHVAIDRRWRDGYTTNNRPVYESGFDLNRWTAARKINHWKQPVNIITPSRWLASCVKESVVMRDWPVSVIPNAIDTNEWKPVDKALARQILLLPQDVPLLLFGGLLGPQHHHKGFDLLKDALNHLRGHIADLELIVFGQMAHESEVDFGCPVRYLGHLHDNVSLRLLYSAVDAVAIPSRIDNFPNNGLEASACGTPIVAFDCCGLADIVDHRVTGFLAKPYEAIDFANGLLWILSESARSKSLGLAARKKAVDLWSYDVIARKYFEAYQNAIKNKH
jgi:glycosyltransferase involved in cell wall biosynthesis